jgi:hypothetical protein
MAKLNTPKPTKPVDPSNDSPIPPVVPEKRVFGSAKGQIVFEKGWDAPMTDRELDDFLRGY